MGTQKINLVDVMKKIAGELLSAPSIATFSRSYGYNDPLIIIGDVLESELPCQEDAPYIYIYGASKAEGLSVDPCVYQVSIGVGIEQLGQETLTSGLIVYKGYSICSELMEIIQQVLFDYRAMSNVDSVIGGSVDPGAEHWIGNITCKWEIEQTISGNQEF